MIHNIETMWSAEDSNREWQRAMRNENAQRQIADAITIAQETGGSIRDAVYQVIKFDRELIELLDL